MRSSSERACLVHDKGTHENLEPKYTYFGESNKKDVSKELGVNYWASSKRTFIFHNSLVEWGTEFKWTGESVCCHGMFDKTEKVLNWREGVYVCGVCKKIFVRSVQRIIAYNETRYLRISVHVWVHLRSLGRSKYFL